MDLKANPEEMQSKVEHWEVPKECAMVKPVRGLRKWHRGWNLAGGQRREPKELTGGSWLPPGGRCPIVQEWHGVRETSSGKFGPREVVDHARNWQPPE
jgi:hypothetical protein